MQGMFTGLLGNLSLLSYFAKKKEKELVVVQTLGVISIYVVIAQLDMAEAMPLPHFIATSIVVASSLALNFLNYFDLLSAGIWRFWEDFITVMWSTFVPYIPNSILPGITAFFLAVAAVVMVTQSFLNLSNWSESLHLTWSRFLHIMFVMSGLVRPTETSIIKNWETMMRLYRVNHMDVASWWACLFLSFFLISESILNNLAAFFFASGALPLIP
ncbi:hypothetical protein LOK49_LG06G02930, partial [Camellia lanceoleosa]